MILVGQNEDTYYVRIEVINNSNHTYRLEAPKVIKIDPAYGIDVAYSHLNRQLSDKEFKKFRAFQQTNVAVHEATIAKQDMVPDTVTDFVLSIQKPVVTPAIFRFVFPSDDGHPGERRCHILTKTKLSMVSLPSMPNCSASRGAQDEVPEIKSVWENPATENGADTLPDVRDGTLPFVRLTGSSSIIAEALGIANEDLPRRHYSSADAFRFAVHLERNVGVYRPNLPKDFNTRKAITREVEKVMSGTVAPRRRDTLLRWFRDPAAPPNLNPWKLIDPKEKVEGNLLQLVHRLCSTQYCSSSASLLWCWYSPTGLEEPSRVMSPSHHNQTVPGQEEHNARLILM